METFIYKKGYQLKVGVHVASRKNYFYLLISILLALIVYLIPLPGIGSSGHAALSLLVFAVSMWISEVVPLAVTSMIILFIQPLMGIQSFEDAVIGFANPIIFLIIGGFIMANAIRESGLALRLTYTLLSKLGISPKRTLFVSIFSTGLLSAWIENVVAFAMLLPVIKEIIDLMGCENAKNGESNFAKSMVLGASFGSLAGGLATEIGTAPNLMAAAYTKIPFLNWMIFGFPLSIILMLIVWKILLRIFPPEVHDTRNKTVDDKLDLLGPMKRNEKITLLILFFAIVLWVTAGWTGIDSYSVALIAGVLFLFTGVISWRDAQKNIDWGLIIFFGGALSLGSALLNTGAAKWLIKDIIVALGSPSPLIITLVLIVLAVSITQVMSNIALAAILVPLSVTLAHTQHLPVGIYAVPVAIACSLSFMLPTADPTVAMAHGTGFVKLRDIPRSGIPIIISGIIVTIFVLFTIARPFLGA
ncbi:DASS family sodium-coupled anion symporter [Methanothermobacter tenebrarum]|uniref:Anion transporter n=1 Tax=Methanothermobacter tenebrarum TaxID=680118 RepID=A0A328PDZ7_9EURY|nr:DASS family sodium-coupled anion symporter [Methanothermobacter tenebrarum]RAO78562.1 anion transporter [Methanothermobacter tenebrarum]